MATLPSARQPQAAEPPPAWSQGGDLPDLNVWLALVLDNHPHHAAARRYWADTQAQRAQGVAVWFCRATMLGLVRLLSQPKLMGEQALNLTEAHAVYRQLRLTQGVALLPDTESADATLPALLGTDTRPLPPRLWADAWLAAVAESSGLRLVSFDADFQRFALARHLWLQG